MSIRDPRSDPQPGDEFKVGDTVRRVIRREGEMLWIECWHRRYMMRLANWQKWCKSREMGSGRGQ